MWNACKKSKFVISPSSDRVADLLIPVTTPVDTCTHMHGLLHVSVSPLTSHVIFGRKNSSQEFNSSLFCERLA